jgi:hypothetical protein
MAVISPQPQTLGQHLDAVLTAAGHDVSIATKDAESFASKAWAWISSEWHNVVTAASTAYLALKAAGKL